MPRVLHSQSFALFLGVRSRFFYPPLTKILEMKEKGGEKEVSVDVSADKTCFQHDEIERERKRGRRFSALRDRKRERENDPRA